MKYDFDSYLLYEITPMSLYTTKANITLRIPVNSEKLRVAAAKAFTRFPYFSRTIRLNAEGAYELIPSNQTITVTEEGDPVVLGSPQTNGLYFAITFKDTQISFCFSHNFCGGSGAMPWIKATLWQYLTDEGYPISSEGIYTPDSAFKPGETDMPDPDALPDDEPLYEYHGEDSFFPVQDYMTYFTNPSEGGQVYFPITIEKDVLMKYAHENDGSPNSILSALMFKMCSRIFPDAKQLSCGIVCNYKDDVNCKNTYRDLVRLLHVKYAPEIKDWPISKLSTITRGAMYLQMEPETSWKYCKKMALYKNEIDQLPDIEQKQKYAQQYSPLRNGPKDSYQISYVGKIDWGELDAYIESVYAVTEGHIMLEVIATSSTFFITFQVLNHDEKYFSEFLKILQEEGIPYKAGKMEESNLPQIVFGEA